jgi:hypothetical protein
MIDFSKVSDEDLINDTLVKLSAEERQAAIDVGMTIEEYAKAKALHIIRSRQVKFEWQTLDTAPKDRMILLGGRDEEGNEWIGTGYWESCEDYPEEFSEPHWNWDTWFAPKYWMHLPELPK